MRWCVDAGIVICLFAFGYLLSRVDFANIPRKKDYLGR